VAEYKIIGNSVIQSQLEIIIGRAFPDKEPSMMADTVAKRTMESGAILGNALRIAQIHNVPTPKLITLFYLVNGINFSFFPSKN
jgi:2-dehydropantoate 2-reductase